MRVQVEKFRQALKLLQPAVSGRNPTMPITQHVLVRDGTLHATNLELAVSVPLPDLDGHPFTFPFTYVRDTLAYLPGYEVLDLQVSDTEIQIKTSRSSFTMHCGDAEEFPPLQAPDEHQAQVDGDAFLAGLEQVAGFVAADTSRPVITGVCVTLGDPVEVAGADGFRLAWQPLGFAIQPPDGISQLIIPAKSVAALMTIWRGASKTPAIPPHGEAPHHSSIGIAKVAVAKRPMNLTFDKASLSCHFGGLKVITQLVDGTFPEYKSLIPQGQDQRIVFEAADFALALRQLLHVGSQGSGVIRLSWEENAMQVSSHSEELGTAETTIPGVSQGGPSHIAFNFKYLLEYFQGREGQVMLEVTNPSNPGLFTHRGTPHVLVMPMHVEWDR